MPAHVASKEIVLTNERGLDEQMARRFSHAACCARRCGAIWIEKDGHRVNGKNVLFLLSLAAGCGSKLTVTVEGEGCHIEEEREYVEDALRTLLNVLEPPSAKPGIQRMPAQVELVLTDANGLHASAARRFSKIASNYQCEIRVHNEGANGKSILDLLSLAAGCGSKLLIRADGEDAEDALRALENLSREGLL